MVVLQVQLRISGFYFHSQYINRFYQKIKVHQSLALGPLERDLWTISLNPSLALLICKDVYLYRPNVAR